MSPTTSEPGVVGDPAPGASPIVLAVSPGDAPPDAAILAVLASEAIELRPAGLEAVLAGDPAACVVLVAWSRAGLDAATCERVVSWARGRRPATGLVAWGGSGERAIIERALAAGFDDAQGAGCSPRELAVRIRAILRRVQRAAAPPEGLPIARVRYRNFVLDPESCELWLDGRAVALTVTEFTALVALLRAQGAVLRRAELLDQAWGGDHLDVGERAVDNVVLRLRRKLGRPGLIRTVRGVGFRIDLDGDGDDEQPVPVASSSIG